jgi:hypothetical protein
MSGVVKVSYWRAPTHQLRVSRVNEVDALGTVDRLDEGVMEKDILNIQLVHSPTPRHGQSQHSVNGGGLHDGVESFIVFHSEAPGEPLNDPTSLAPIQRTIRLEIVLKDPLVSHHIGPRGHGIKSDVLLDSRVSYS